MGNRELVDVCLCQERALRVPSSLIAYCWLRQLVILRQLGIISTWVASRYSKRKLTDLANGTKDINHIPPRASMNCESA